MSTPPTAPQFPNTQSPNPQPPQVKPRPIRWEKWTAIGTVLMALCALLTSFWQGYQLQRHNKLSVRPVLQFEINTGATNSGSQVSFNMWLLNNGLGPANVTEASIWLGDKKLNSTQELWPALGVSLPANCTGSGALRRFYKVGDRQLVFRTNNDCYIDKAVAERIEKELKLEVVYESLYGESYQMRL